MAIIDCTLNKFVLPGIPGFPNPGFGVVKPSGESATTSELAESNVLLAKMNQPNIIVENSTTTTIEYNIDFVFNGGTVLNISDRL